MKNSKNGSHLPLAEMIATLECEAATLLFRAIKRMRPKTESDIEAKRGSLAGCAIRVAQYHVQYMEAATSKAGRYNHRRSAHKWLGAADRLRDTKGKQIVMNLVRELRKRTMDSHDVLVAKGLEYPAYTKADEERKAAKSAVARAAALLRKPARAMELAR